MVDGKRQDHWDHTSELIALLANIHRDKKKQRKPFKSDQIHPYRVAAKQESNGDKHLIRWDIKDLKPLFGPLKEGGAKR